MTLTIGEKRALVRVLRANRDAGDMRDLAVVLAKLESHTQGRGLSAVAITIIEV